MDVLEAIKTRRSIGRVLDKEVPEQLIEQILEAGTWAPTHHLTEPWRFFVMTGSGRKKLGDVLAAIAADKLENPESEEGKNVLEKERKKPFRAPVVIAVAVEPSELERVIVKEEYAAVNAAIQNMLLAAHALGLGAVWRTGKPCYDPRMKELFQLSPKGEVLGFIYIGYPDMKPPVKKRKPVDEVAVWIRNENHAL